MKISRFGDPLSHGCAVPAPLINKGSLGRCKSCQFSLSIRGILFSANSDTLCPNELPQIVRTAQKAPYVGNIQF